MPAGRGQLVFTSRPRANQILIGDALYREPKTSPPKPLDLQTQLLAFRSAAHQALMRTAVPGRQTAPDGKNRKNFGPPRPAERSRAVDAHY